MTDAKQEHTTEEMSLLSDQAILRLMGEGKVLIEPFNRKNLSTSSYDVTLGEFFYRESPPTHGELNVYNPYSESMVTKGTVHLEFPNLTSQSGEHHKLPKPMLNGAQEQAKYSKISRRKTRSFG